MKDFDLAAAKRGAKVCTRDRRPAKFLGLIEDSEGNVFVIAEVITQMNFFNDGRNFRNTKCEHDLMMADDDYLEKLERGEYDHIEDNLEMVDKYDHIGEATEKVDWGYWRMMYAGMAMQGLLARFCPAPYCNCSNVDQYQFTASESVEYADALIAELKKTK